MNKKEQCRWCLEKTTERYVVLGKSKPYHQRCFIDCSGEAIRFLLDNKKIINRIT